MPVPQPPIYVSLENFFQGSHHSDVTVFQAALVRCLQAPLKITGKYDAATEALVLHYGEKAQSEMGISLVDFRNRVPTPNKNFIKMVDLELREYA